jgi:hypothetical protein
VKQRYFKIKKNDHEELYSRGGGRIEWSPKGKIWVGLGPLKNHMHNVADGWRIPQRNTYAEAIIVEYELVPTGNPQRAADLYQDIKEQRRNKEEVRVNAKVRAAERAEIEQLRVLKKKYPSV